MTERFQDNHEEDIRLDYTAMPNLAVNKLMADLSDVGRGASFSEAVTTDNEVGTFRFETLGGSRIAAVELIGAGYRTVEHVKQSEDGTVEVQRSVQATPGMRLTGGNRGPEGLRGNPTSLLESAQVGAYGDANGLRTVRGMAVRKFGGRERGDGKEVVLASGAMTAEDIVATFGKTIATLEACRQQSARSRAHLGRMAVGRPTDSVPYRYS